MSIGCEQTSLDYLIRDTVRGEDEDESDYRRSQTSGSKYLTGEVKASHFLKQLTSEEWTPPKLLRYHMPIP